jgi:hypothetical protein
VFPEAIPSVSASESEAKVTEDIPAALAEEEKEEEGEATLPASDPVLQEENVIVPDPPVVEEMEVENNEVATTNTTEANDTVMAEDNVEPKANAATDTIVQPIASDNAVPPPRPHTMDRAFNRGELVTVRWPIMVPPTAPSPQYDYHVELRSQSQDCQGFPMLQQLRACSVC